MKILITGGTGYIGTELCQRLMHNPEIESIRIYDNLSRKNFNFFLGDDKLSSKVSFVEAELLDSYSLRKEVAKVDTVIHLAAKVTTPFADQSPHLFDQVNNWGTAELCYAIEESDCQNLIYMSSASVYGSSEVEVGGESTPKPKTFYGISKLKGEKHAERLKEKKNVSIIRCANVYGYSRSLRFDAVINKFVFDAKNAGRVNINGNGEQNRAFISINRVVDFMEKLIETPDKKLHYDLVDRNLSINDVAYTLKELFPEMEMLYVDQQLSLRQIKLKLDPNIPDLIGENTESLMDELKHFVSKMA